MKLFSKIDDKRGLNFEHIENNFNYFDQELLLSHKYSRFGPGITKGDVNNDGLDDVYICGARGQSGALYIQINSNAIDLIKVNSKRISSAMPP